MINFSTRKPAAVKAAKFSECTHALSELETIVYKILHEHHTKVLLSLSPVYWINFHAFDIECGNGTIKISLIKNQNTLSGIEVRYSIKNERIEFFDQEADPIASWEGVVARLMSEVH